MTDHAAHAAAHLETVLDEIALAVHEGFDLGDIPLVVMRAMEVADLLGDATGDDKLAFAQAFASEVLADQLTECGPQLEALIERIDVPFMPEAMERAVVDPLLKAWAPAVLRSALREIMPGLFDLVVAATRGEVKVNAPAPCCDVAHDGECVQRQEGEVVSDWLLEEVDGA